MKGPRRPYWRRIKAGRAVFNAAAELCRVLHPTDYHTGDMACGVCYERIARTINNPSGKGRVSKWGTYVINNIDIYGRMPGDENYDSSCREVDRVP